MYGHDKEKTVEFFIRSLARHMRYVPEKQLEQYGITQQQGKLLGFLHFSKRKDLEISRKTLQEAMNISGPSVTSILDRLEKNGLIVRTSSKEDGRALNVLVTEKGEGLIEKVHKIFKETDEQMLTGLTEDEIETLRSLLAKVHANVEAGCSNSCE